MQHQADLQMLQHERHMIQLINLELLSIQKLCPQVILRLSTSKRAMSLQPCERLCCFLITSAHAVQSWQGTHDAL